MRRSHQLAPGERERGSSHGCAEASAVTASDTRTGGQAKGAPGALVVIGLLAALAPRAAQAEQLACRLRVGVEPRTVTVEQPRAHVSIVTPGERPRLVPSAGAIQEVRRESAYTFAAEYAAPHGAAPRVAVIAAVLDDGGCGMGIVHVQGPEGSAGAPEQPAPIAVVFLPQFVEADQGADVLAYVFAADDAGNPRGGAPPAVKVGVGKVSAAEPLGPGAWRARWHVPPRGTSGAVLTVSFAGGAAASAALTGSLASLEVELDRRRVVSGDPEPVVVTVRAWDASHNPTDADLAVSADAGDLSEPARVERGVYRARLAMPAGASGSGAINIQARAGALRGEASLAFGPGEPTSVVIAGPDSIPGDGSTSFLFLSVVDSQGNPVDDVEPAVQAQRATVGAPSHVGPGRWMVAYRAHRVIEPVKDLVVVRAGPATGQRSLQVAAPANRFSLGPKIGLGVQSGGVGLAAGGEAAAWMRLGGQQLGLVLEASYWSLASSGTIESLGAYTNERSYFPVFLSAAWRRPLGRRMMAWAAAGGGAAHVATSNRLSAQPVVSDTAWAPVASAGLSLGLWAWSGFPFVELRGTWVGDPRLPTLRGSLTSVLFQVGYRFHVD